MLKASFKHAGVWLAGAVGVAFAVPALAYHIEVKPNGNLSINGAHYNLNIIGVSKGKEGSAMTGSNRHTIFVGLGSKGSTVTTKIYLNQGADFKVCDGNGFDAAYDCDGQQIATSGASFQLPCNTHITADGATTVLPCDGGETAAYEIFARALGSPKDEPFATMTTCATEVTDQNGTGTLTELCSTENVVLVRQSGKSRWQNVTQELSSLCVDYPAGGNPCDTRYALFRDEFEDWNWQYDNNGLRLAQLRFYLLGPDD